MLDINLIVRKVEIDRIKLQRELDRSSAKVLKKFGAYTRRNAQQSMRRAKDDVHAAPGEPLKSHGEQKYKKAILFSYDPSTKTVIIGPTLFSRTARYKIPRLHERSGDDRRGHYEERPVMKPAFHKALTNLRQYFVE